MTVTFPVVVTGKVWQETSDQSVGANLNNVQSSVYTLPSPPNKPVSILTVTSDSNRTSGRKGESIIGQWNEVEAKVSNQGARVGAAGCQVSLPESSKEPAHLQPLSVLSGSSC